MNSPVTTMAAPIKCALVQKLEEECDNFSKCPKETEFIRLEDCQKNITDQLKSSKLPCGLQSGFSSEVEHEGHLIALRAGIFR